MKKVSVLLVVCLLLPLMAVPAMAAETVTLRFSTYSDEARMVVVNELIAEFMAVNPGIVIEVEHVAQSGHYDKKLAETASGTLPDVWELVPGAGSYWIERGLLLDILPYVEADETISLDDFDQSMIQYYNKGGKLFGLPYDSNGVCLYYNKDLLDEAGIAYPDGTWTYDDLYKNMMAGQEALAAKGKKIWGLSSPISGGWSGVGYFDAMGTPLVNAEGKIGVNDTQTVEGLTLWLNMMKDGCMPEPEPANPANVITLGATTFMNGESMFHLGGTAVKLFDEKGLNYGAAPAPLGPTGVRGAKLGGGFVITAATKHPEEAYKFLSFITSEDAMRRFVGGAGIPTRKALYDGLEGTYKDVAMNISGDGYTWLNAVQGCSQIWSLKDTLLQQMWIGMLTPEQVVEELITEGADILEIASE